MLICGFPGCAPYVTLVKENVSVQYSNQVMVALLELVTVLTN